MSRAAVMVKIILGETGEADQDYEQIPFDSIVDKLAAEGFTGATHREFDKYQGVYLKIPGIDRFWASWEFIGLTLTPENDPRPSDEEATPAVIPIDVNPETGEADISDLLHYIHDRYGAKIASAKAQNDAEDFINTKFS